MKKEGEGEEVGGKTEGEEKGEEGGVKGRKRRRVVVVYFQGLVDFFISDFSFFGFSGVSLRGRRGCSWLYGSCCSLC